MAITSKKIIQVISGEGGPCPFCNDVQLQPFEKACNHLMEIYRLKCLHIGQETEMTDYGPWQNTVAVFGL